MAPKKTPKTPFKTQSVDWGQVLDQLATSASGPFFFVKANKTKLRLICLEEDERNFFCPATTYFKGKPKEKMIMFAIVLGTDKGELSEKWVDKIVPVVVTKTALQGIISILADGYDLFSAEGGHGITIIRSGTGTDTTYNVLPSPQPVPIDLNQYEAPELSLIEYAEMLSQRGGNQPANENEGDW